MSLKLENSLNQKIPDQMSGADIKEKAAWIQSEVNRLGPQWHSPVELGHGVNTGSAKLRKRFARRLRLLQLPENLSGMRVLDIGTWDGFFALEMEHRGAEVIAVDIWDDIEREKFEFVLKARDSKIEHHRIDVHDLDPAVLGEFDIVLCAGVLYHCRYPLIALEKILGVTKGYLILETVTLIPAFHRNVPMKMFFPGDEEAIRKNWPWRNAGAATLPWIYEALLSAGFNRVEHVYRPSFSIWKGLVAMFTNKPSRGRSVTHAYR